MGFLLAMIASNAPFLAKASAHLEPRPADAPVITTRLPVKKKANSGRLSLRLVSRLQRIQRQRQRSEHNGRSANDQPGDWLMM
jgi:hypothetical protein